ncbi:hypothetical protein U1769_23480 [Sphingomonas sp. ZT3P38]|uniref:hypothetical protein n=1 Tax=Parasphingomonas zepuensis TaxID=3096161 RepID=UPI002FCC6842
MLVANCHEPENQCSSQFATDYPALDRFREQIQLMMQDRTGIATLDGLKANLR